MEGITTPLNFFLSLQHEDGKVGDGMKYAMISSRYSFPPSVVLGVR